MRSKSKSKNKAIKWLWKDFLYPHKKALIVNFLLDLGGFLGQIAAYGLLLKYVGALEQTTELNLLGRSFEPKSSQTLLTGVALGTGLLFLIYSLIDYWSKLRVISLQRKYEEFCSDRVILMLEKAHQSDGSGNSKGGYDARRLRKALIKDSRFCGKAVKVTSGSIIIFIKFIGSLVFMFHVSTSLTLVILLLMVPMILLLKRQGKNVVNLTQLRETKILGFVQDKKQQMQIAISGKRMRDESNENVRLKEGVKHFYNVYYAVMKQLALSDFVIILFIALLSVVIVLVAGNLVLFGSMSWTIFIAYMVVLRFFFSSLQGLNAFIKKSSRIYDYVEHYMLTLEALESGNGVPVLDPYSKTKTTTKKNSDAIAFDLDDGDDDDDDDDM